MCTAPFSNYKVFKDDMEQSTLSDFRANLAANMAQQQATIDLEFPHNQPNQTRDNAIFSDILRRGNRQANKLLECLVPFIDVLIGAKVPVESAWLKGLSIYKTIFDQVTKACTISSEPTSATMCWGMMKATDLLDEFSKLEFARHPKVTYAMSLSAMWDYFGQLTT